MSASPTPKSPRGRPRHTAEAGWPHSEGRNPVVIAERDPCFRCAVPKDRHAEHGCKRWKGSV